VVRRSAFPAACGICSPASFGLGTTSDDIDGLLDALTAILR
jgi:hypothetical protein